MPEIPRFNGKNWLAKGLVQVIIILALGTYIAIDKLSGSNSPKPLTDRVLVLEECVRRLNNVPEDVVYLKTKMVGVELQLDKIERKLDSQR